MKKYLENYLEKRRFQKQIELPLSGRQIDLIVVIPVFYEFQLRDTIESLLDCEAPENKRILLLVIINDANSSSKKVKDHNQITFQFCQSNQKCWSTGDIECKSFYFSNLPDKKSGVGLARKIGMDMALTYFSSIRLNGIIACLDADCTVDKNYFTAAFECFIKHPQIEALHFNFAHPFENEDDPVVSYELHLRYMIDAQRWAGYPLAFQTVGSCMAVRAYAYAKVGGMNTRKAGEDFYFLMKFAENYRLMDCMSTTIYPSGRKSDRVPFGTGKAVGEIRDGKVQLTYHRRTYQDLNKVMNCLNSGQFYEKDHWGQISISETVEHFFTYYHARDKIGEIKKHTASERQFRKRFLQWFSPFMVMKYQNFCQDFYPGLPVEEAVSWLAREMGIEGTTHIMLLKGFRDYDRSHPYLSE